MNQNRAIKMSISLKCLAAYMVTCFNVYDNLFKYFILQTKCPHVDGCQENAFLATFRPNGLQPNILKKNRKSLAC